MEDISVGINRQQETEAQGREDRSLWCPVSGFQHLGNDPKMDTSATLASLAWGWWDDHKALGEMGETMEDEVPYYWEGNQPQTGSQEHI